MPTTTATPGFATADLCDAHEDRLAAGTLRVLDPALRHYGQRRRFAGPAVTVRCLEDNSLVRAALETPGEGRVLVVDGGGSLRCALLGGNLARLVRDHAWAGVIVHGCVRDVTEIDALDVGVRALAAHPRRSDRRGGGARDLPVDIAGVRVAPGNWCYADEDGVVVSDAPLAMP